MNCMKHRRAREKQVDRIIHPLLKDRIDRFMAESMIIGTDKALENLRKENEALKEQNNKNNDSN